MRSTTTALIIKIKIIVQTTIGGINEKLSKEPSVTAALNFLLNMIVSFRVYDHYRWAVLRECVWVDRRRQ